MMAKAALLAFVVLCCGGVAAESSGTISGVVLSAISGVPLAGSTVALSSADGSPLRTLVADRRGRYVFEGLPAGYYLVKASRPNFATGRYGQKAWNQVGRPIELGLGAGFTADILLHRLGVITGSVVDENGEGLPNLTVNAVTVSPHGLVGRVSSAGITDDRGVFRIIGLKPGRYYVTTTARRLEDGAGLLPTYHPRALRMAEARVVGVEIDRETEGVHIQPIPGHLLRLSGTVAAAAQRKDAQVTVTLFRDEDSFEITAGPGGQFGFSQVVPGRYTLVAELNSPETRLAAYQPLEIYSDIEGLYVNLAPAPEIRVRLVDEDGAEVNDPQFVIFLSRIENGARTQPVRTEPRVSARLMPGRWRFFVIVPEAYVVESASAGERDGLEGFTLLPGQKVSATIRVARRAGLARGRVTDRDGLAGRGVSVVCYPLSPQNRYRLGGFRSVRTDLAGEYRLAGLPEGEYLVFATAVEDWNPEDPLDELKERVPPVKVAPSSELTHNLRIFE